MKNEKAKIDNGKKIKSVTLIPCSMLTVLGWLDALKGEESVPNAKVDRFLNKCKGRERLEALIIESRCERDRKAGALAIVKISAFDDANNAIPADFSDGSPHSIRANARNTSKRNALLAEREQAKATLIEVNESLIHADTVLCERIRKTREKALNTKIAAYIKGVRKKIPGYNPNLELSDDAYTVYKAKHEVGDTAIFNAVSKMSKEAC